MGTRLIKGYKTCPKCGGLGLRVSKNGIARPCEKCECMGYIRKSGESIFNGDASNAEKV